MSASPLSQRPGHADKSRRERNGLSRKSPFARGVRSLTGPPFPRGTLIRAGMGRPSRWVPDPSPERRSIRDSGAFGCVPRRCIRKTPDEAAFPGLTDKIPSKRKGSCDGSLTTEPETSPCGGLLPARRGRAARESVSRGGSGRGLGEGNGACLCRAPRRQVALRCGCTCTGGDAGPRAPASVRSNSVCSSAPMNGSAHVQAGICAIKRLSPPAVHPQTGTQTGKHRRGSPPRSRPPWAVVYLGIGSKPGAARPRRIQRRWKRRFRAGPGQRGVQVCAWHRSIGCGPLSEGQQPEPATDAAMTHADLYLRSRTKLWRRAPGGNHVHVGPYARERVYTALVQPRRFGREMGSARCRLASTVG